MISKAILIYDGSCPMCRGARNWLVRRAREDSFTTVACQAAEDRCDLDDTARAQCRRAMCLLLPDGSMYSGVDAMPHILSRLHGWGWASRLFKMPGIKHLARAVYFVVSRNRYLLSRLMRLSYDESECGCNTKRKL